jgi:hypothetical protein
MTTLADDKIIAIAQNAASANNVRFESVTTAPALDSMGGEAY